MIEKIKKFFKVEERGSTIGIEVLGGLVTFLAMVYILPVNAGMLSQTGMSFGGVFAATALAAAFATILMGVVGKVPIALASGMGVNAFFTFTVVFTLGFSPAEALAAVFVSGVLFLIISLTGLRKIIINAIPKGLKLAIGAGIGFFIAFIGLKNGGVIVADPATFVRLGNFAHPTVLLSLFGILLILVIFVMNQKVSRFAIIIAILVTGLLGALLGAIFPSLTAFMPSIGGANLGSIGDVGGLFGNAITALPSLFAQPLALSVIFTFLFIDFFDTAGTLVAVGSEAGLLDEEGQLKDANKALVVDAVGTVFGSIVGTSTVTSYIESTTGIKSGARTGLASVVTGLLFLLALLFFPLFSIVNGINSGYVDVFGAPIFYSPVTSMALVFVGILMVRPVKDIDWNDPILAASSFITILVMMLSFSIAEGIGFGFISYALMMGVSSRRKEANPIIYILGVLFVINLILYYNGLYSYPFWP
ncbi:MAG: NCS2 family permease [Acholeplasmataceae bacterium]